MPAHCGTTDVRIVLGLGTTHFNEGSAEVLVKIAEADRLIDKRLDTYDLSVSGTSQPLITDCSKYWSAALYQQDFYIRRDEGGNIEAGQAKIWWGLGSTFLNTYINYQTEDYTKKPKRYRRMLSTTTENP